MYRCHSLKTGCMICVSLANIGYEECLALVKEEPFVEFRFDKLDLSADEIRRVVGSSKRSIATFRPGTDAQEMRMQTLLTAIRAGATYVDIELDADPRYRKELIKDARAAGCDVIISYHNFDRTPEIRQLKKIAASCRKLGADVVKLACRVNAEEDVRVLMSLYDEAGRMAVIGMGEKGLITRIAGPFMGAEFTFASPGSGKETAPGQIDRKSLESLILRIRELSKSTQP